MTNNPFNFNIIALIKEGKMTTNDPFEARRIMMCAFFDDRKYLDTLSAETGLDVGEIMNICKDNGVSSKEVLNLYSIFQHKILEPMKEQIEKQENVDIFEILKK